MFYEIDRIRRNRPHRARATGQRREGCGSSRGAGTQAPKFPTWRADQQTGCSTQTAQIFARIVPHNCAG